MLISDLFLGHQPSVIISGIHGFNFLNDFIFDLVDWMSIGLPGCLRSGSLKLSLPASCIASVPGGEITPDTTTRHAMPHCARLQEWPSELPLEGTETEGWKVARHRDIDDIDDIDTCDAVISLIFVVVSSFGILCVILCLKVTCLDPNWALQVWKLSLQKTRLV